MEPNIVLRDDVVGGAVAEGIELSLGPLIIIYRRKQHRAPCCGREDVEAREI